MGCCFPCFSAVTKEEEGKLVQDAQSDPAKGKDGLFPPPADPWLPAPQHPHHHHHQQQQQQHPPPQIHRKPPQQQQQQQQQRQQQQQQQQPPQQQHPIKLPPAPSDRIKPKTPFDEKKESEAIDIGKLPIEAHTFTFRELALATKNFRSECFLGEGGFGRVYKGCLESTGQIVAVKQLDRNGLQGNREFLVEVLMLSLLHHTNLVNLIGYCADGDQRLLVYEYMSLGSLEDHLHDLPQGKEPLEWSIRMKIAAGAAKGLEYLHDKANPPVIYRDLKCSNILLDETFHPKLSDFGLAKLGPVGDKSHVSTRVMGTYGYCAPEYAMTGQLTVKSDVYSFGVVLLELITGRRAIDNCRKAGEQNLVSWARPLFKDRKKFPQMADPALKGHYPMRGLYQALAVAAMCLQEEATARPVIGDVVTALSYLASQTHDPAQTPVKGGTAGKEKKESDMKVEGGKGGGAGGLDEAGHKLFKQGLPGSPRDKDTLPQDTLAKDSSAEYSDNNPPSEGRNDAAVLLTDRERAVAEARSWGESWREKMRGSTRAGFDDP